MFLTEALIRQVLPRENQFRLYDSKGLLILVTPAGGYLWRFKYRFGGKQKSLSFGTYPDISLKEARMKRDEP
ncbi:MAG: Arm DNA-binding domain-containing protein [Nitrospirae bacterium]|nr:Arm DNA-binding domain-containing protein [Nitrospirota bacterium]